MKYNHKSISNEIHHNKYLSEVKLHKYTTRSTNMYKCIKYKLNK